MEQHRTINFEGRTLHYRDEGRENQQTVVLLHGFLQNLDVWSPYVLNYMHTMRVITIDLPGHGHTDTYCETHTMEFMARAVKAVLIHAGVDQCVLIGHSMGGYVALAFAEEYPYHLRGLGLVNSHAMADSTEQREQRNKICEQVREQRASYIVNAIPTLFDESRQNALHIDIKDLQDQCLETSTESILAAQRGMAMRKSRLDILAKLEIPILFVFGKNDRRIPIEYALSQAMIPRYSEVMMLDKVAHMAFIEEKEYVKPRIFNFVRTCYL